jgi:hypothetical protein
MESTEGHCITVFLVLKGSLSVGMYTTINRRTAFVVGGRTIKKKGTIRVKARQSGRYEVWQWVTGTAKWS